MEINYKLEQFEGPLDLLLTLIQKNKVSITDIPIAIICDQYVEYISKAQELDMEVASEFIVMASELMLIEAVQKLTPMYAYYSGRMVKDTDEISVDKTFVQDQDVSALCAAVRRIVAYNNALEKAATTTFKPMISKPIIPVEIKIVSIIKRIEDQGAASLEELLVNEATLPDMIASFLGVLELIKVRKLILADTADGEEIDNALLGVHTRFVLNTDQSDIEESEYLIPDNTDEAVQESLI